MPQNILTTKNHVLPTGLDPTRLAQWMMRDGSSYQQVRNLIVDEFTRLNLELQAGWGEAWFVTPEDHFEYENGGSLDDFPDITDLDKPPFDIGNTFGHMIDLRVRGKAIGGSGRFFRDARSAIIISTARRHANAGRQTFEKQFLTRGFTNTETALGSSGYDVPVVRGTGGNVDFVPPAFGGQVFVATHDHFNGVDSDTLGFDDMLDTLANDVSEHGHNGNLIAYVAAADAASYRALGDTFVQPTANAITIIDRGGDNSGATFFSNNPIGQRAKTGMTDLGAYIGTAGIITLKTSFRIPTGYAYVFNSYGQNDERNPIAVRIHPDVGFGFFIAEIPNFQSDYPVKEIHVNIEYGISVTPGRTNGSAGFLVSGGAWVNPAIV